MSAELVNAYAAGATVLETAIAGLSVAELTAYPVPGTWSIREIAWHLADSDLISAYRMKWVIAEDNPPLVAYCETRFARELAYNQRDEAPACTLFRANRLHMAEILRSLPLAAWTRTGQHSERGPLTLRQLVEYMVEHLDHHLAFIRKKRALLRPGEKRM